MPYIKQDQRRALHVGAKPEGPGELNYLITRAVHKFIEDRGLTYATINEAIGVLECAKLELYRMVAAPYEDNKQRENGSVSDLDADGRAV